MRRMIPGFLIDKIKKLFMSVWTDKEGNVDIGNNLEVDGNITAIGEEVGFIKISNGAWYIAYIAPGSHLLYLTDLLHVYKVTDSAGNPIRTIEGLKDIDMTKTFIDNDLAINFDVYFNHSLAIVAGSGETAKTYFVDVVATTNLVIDSLQDLSSVLGASRKVGLGSAQLAFDTIWKVGGVAVTSVSDSVTKI